MKSKRILQISLLVIVLLFGIFQTARAQVATTIHLTITTNSGPIFDKDITVNACNSDNGNTSTVEVTAYCAVLQTNLPSDWNWSWPPGAFLNSLDNIAGSTTKDVNGNDVYHYWSWTLERDSSISDADGLNEYILQPNDVILLNFVDPGNTTPIPAGTASSSGGYGERHIITTVSSGVIIATPTTPPATTLPPVKASFDSTKALNFLASQQKNDGSFGEDLYTDWSAIALASNSSYQDQKTKLAAYLSENKLAGNLLTDYERRAMALMALGFNPYDTNGENYINDIVKNFDGKQFGDPNEDNDDVFALIVLQNAGYTQGDSIINTDINFILSKQGTDGSWDNSVDMTGATMEALSSFRQNEQVENALTKAENYLKQNQKDDGSWNENASSTAWAIEGILAQNEKPENWSSSNGKNTPLDYLATIQDTDGGLPAQAGVNDSDLNTKIWETEYAVSALSGKTWNQIMQSFGKENLPAPVVNPPAPTPKAESTNIVSVKKIEKLVTKNTATVLNAIPLPTPTSISRQNWFMRLLEKIF